MMSQYRLNPVDSLDDMRKLLEVQPEEEGTLLAYLNKFHYPLWITQFYENIRFVVSEIIEEAYGRGVRVLELRYSPIIHTYAGLTLRQSIRAVLSGMNYETTRHPDLKVGLIVIAMRQHGPHIATILARQAISEAQHLHRRAGVVGFDIAGMEVGHPPRLFREAYEIARLGHLRTTAHAGEDEAARNVWEALDILGVDRVGHGCSATGDKELLQRLARDRVLVECCLSSNYQTGAVKRGAPHPIVSFIEHGVPVAICTDNTTVSRTDLAAENKLAAELLGADAVATIAQDAINYSFLRDVGRWKGPPGIGPQSHTE